VDTVLDTVEVRVLGALLEKEITTPEYYPLTLNALTNACNQKSNRDPVVSYEDGDVLAAIDSLREKRLAMTIIPSGSRVHKYSHRISDAFNLGRRETAVFCSLMLRGAQTLGELHSRSERMHPFDDIAEVESVLERLMTFEPALAVKLPKLPGTKEPRYTHLLRGEPLIPAVEERAEAPRREDRVAALEAEVAELRLMVAELQAKLEEFRSRFD
jgi:uncharacterized protein YceH (UPF0502 family)